VVAVDPGQPLPDHQPHPQEQGQLGDGEPVLEHVRRIDPPANPTVKWNRLSNRPRHGVRGHRRCPPHLPPGVVPLSTGIVADLSPGDADGTAAANQLPEFGGAIREQHRQQRIPTAKEKS
jgi:hypothetical protein